MYNHTLIELLKTHERREKVSNSLMDSNSSNEILSFIDINKPSWMAALTVTAFFNNSLVFFFVQLTIKIYYKMLQKILFCLLLIFSCLFSLIFVIQVKKIFHKYRSSNNEHLTHFERLVATAEDSLRTTYCLQNFTNKRMKVSQ